MRSEDLPEVMTSGDVARLLRVAPRTVSKWMDAGRLRGFRLPGTRPGTAGDRRFTRRAVVEFCAEFGWPLEELTRPANRQL